MTEQQWRSDGHWLEERKGVRCFEVKSAGIDAKKRIVPATVSTDVVDRDGEIVAATAFKGRIASYRKSPVLLWNHDPFTPPIGKTLSLEFREKSVDAEFFFREDDALAQNIFSAYQQGILTSFSVGFRTFKDEDIRDAEGKAIRRVVDAELLEISAVTLPANTDAVVRLSTMADTLKSALYPRAGETEAKTIYATPTDLDVLKRCVVIVRNRIEQMRENKSLVAAERAAIEEIRLLALGLSAPTVDASKAKVAEQLRQLIDDLKNGGTAA